MKTFLRNTPRTCRGECHPVKYTFPESVNIKEREVDVKVVGELQSKAATNPTAPANPAPMTASARGAAAPVKTGATAVDGGALEVVVDKTGVELVTVMNMDDTGVEGEDKVAQVADGELELMTTGLTGVVDDEEVMVESHGPQAVDEDELVVTGKTGVTGEDGTNGEMDDQGPQASDEEELVTTGFTGVVDGEEVDEEVQTTQISEDEDELVTIGFTGVVDEEEELADVVQTAQISVEDEELGTTGLTGVVDDEELDDEVQAPQISEEEDELGVAGFARVVGEEEEFDEEVHTPQASDEEDEELVTTGLTGVVEEEEDEVVFHTPHTVDGELEHNAEDTTVVVIVTGGTGT